MKRVNKAFTLEGRIWVVSSYILQNLLTFWEGDRRPPIEKIKKKKLNGSLGYFDVPFWRTMYRASYFNAYISQRDAQILVNGLYFFR